MVPTISPTRFPTVEVSSMQNSSISNIVEDNISYSCWTLFSLLYFQQWRYVHTPDQLVIRRHTETNCICLKCSLSAYSISITSADPGSYTFCEYNFMNILRALSTKLTCVFRASPTLHLFQPTDIPTRTPTIVPTIDPTLGPTLEPTISPTDSPTNFPTRSPSISPVSDSLLHCLRAVSITHLTYIYICCSNSSC